MLPESSVVNPSLNLRSLRALPRCYLIKSAMSSNVKSWRSTWHSLAALARGAAAMLLVLAGLLVVSQPVSEANGKLVNISTRALVETGDEVMIGGFIIADNPKTVLVQARGTELANDDPSLTDLLADPVLSIISNDTGEEIMANDNWEDSQGQDITEAWKGSPNLMAGSLSAAAIITLDPGNYTAIVRGKNAATGLAQVEVYDLDSAGAIGRLVNISTRALVETGDEVMIGGFIIADNPKTVLVQARGTELANDDPSLTDLLADPVLSIISNDTGEEIMANDNWEDSQGQDITEAWKGSPNLMAGSLSAAAIITLDPGNYTAIVRGKNAATGLAQVEVYDLDSPGSGSPEREALTALYNGTEGANWRRSENWGTEAPLDQWHGLAVDGESRVIELDLPRNQLSGPIPAELGNLVNLELLSLFDNQLSGPIPAELGRLTSLEILNLSRNQLTGAIPAGLGNLANLEALVLSDNRLTGPIPAELGRLTNLDGLFLFRNELSGPIPAELSELSNLQRLILADNQLSGQIPVELSKLSNLERLSLGDNQLSGQIPAELSELSNLQFLYLNDNQLTGPIPVELGELTNLVVLLLRNNQLTGPIPAELSELSNLQFLYLSDNQLTGPIPAELGNLPNLEAIYLGGNPLSGCIPNGLRDVAEGDLSMLGLPYCGTTSSDRASLVALYNATDGPNWTNNVNWLTEAPLGDWEGVTTDAATGRVVSLDLRGNNLTGPIPAELGNLANLETIYLGGNQFSGCIPIWLLDVAESDLSTLGLQDCGTISSDRAALVALYNATDGPNWTNSVNWLTEAPLGRWEGVTTDAATGRVVGLDLLRNNLTGPIPPELGNLASLERLWLWENQLSGSIPAELSELANLISLYLNDNQLSGPIPAELGNLANLQFLILACNKLSGSIPAELSELANLRILYLNDNQLGGMIPAELGNLVHLDAIFLGGNQLTGCIPTGLWGKREGDLSTLGLEYCGPIPGDRAALVAFYNATDGPNWNNSANWLTDAPFRDWEGVTTDATTGRVVGLNLVGKNLNGTIPAELGNLANLQHLDLFFNQLTGPIPAELGNLADLERLYLQENQLSGSIPPELGNLANLERLDLSSNQLTGPIPPELGNLANLEEIRLHNNQLTGPIPPELGNLASLQFLYLYDNQLTGPIPPELGNLANLKGLLLDKNQLSGQIPAELGNLANLDAILLGGNQFSGCIPNELRDLPEGDFSSLGLQFCGPISTDQAALVALYDATDGPNWNNNTNWLVGAWLRDWHGVTTDATTGRVVGLDLRRNNLAGPIPPELGNLANLEVLYFHENQLSGRIPPELGKLSNLKGLYLNINQLSDPIPPELGKLTNLKLLFLNVNQLSGSIPSELGNLTNLEWLHLSDNHLSGCIPGGLRDLADADDLSVLGLPFCEDLDVPDLVVLSPSVSDTSPNTGNSFTFSATVRNQAGGESAATTLRYYRSEDASITPSDTAVGTDAVDAIAALGTSDQSIELTAPSTAGRYFYGACVEAVPDEYDTTNNCSLWVQVDVE